MAFTWTHRTSRDCKKRTTVLHKKKVVVRSHASHMILTSLWRCGSSDAHDWNAGRYGVVLLLTLKQTNKQTNKKLWIGYTVFHRSIAAATNYFVLQVTEATIRGRRLFEGGVNKFIYTKLPCSSSVSALFSTAYL